MQKIQKYASNVITNNFNVLGKKSKIKKPDAIKLRKLGTQILKKGTCVLRHLEDETKKTNRKKQGEIYGNLLEKVQIKSEINEILLKNFKKNLTEETVIGFDLTDEIHEYSDPEKNGIEKISKVIDGSKRELKNGFFLQGIGTEKNLLSLEYYDSEKEFLPQKRKETLKKLLDSFAGKGVWAFDRGNDDSKLFKFLSEENAKFIVRLKKNRLFCDSKTGEVYTFDSLKIGRTSVFIKKSGKNKFDLNEEFFVIKQKHLEHKNPILILCSKKLEKFSDENLVKKYLERWGVENQFRRIKVIYKLESMVIRTFKRRENMLSLILFMHFISKKIQEKIFSEKNDLNSFAFLAWKQLKIFLKRVSKAYNDYSFVDFIRSIFPKKMAFFLPVKSKPLPLSNKLSLFDF